MNGVCGVSSATQGNKQKRTYHFTAQWLTLQKIALRFLLSIIIILASATVMFAQASKYISNKPDSISEENKIFEAYKGRLQLPISNCISIDTGSAKLGLGSSIFISQSFNSNSLVKAVFPCHVISITEFSSNIDTNYSVLCQQGCYAITLENLKSIKVKQGDKLEEGDIIGVVGENNQGKERSECIISSFFKKDLNAAQWLDLRSQKIGEAINL